MNEKNEWMQNNTVFLRGTMFHWLKATPFEGERTWLLIMILLLVGYVTQGKSLTLYVLMSSFVKRR